MTLIEADGDGAARQGDPGRRDPRWWGADTFTTEESRLRRLQFAGLALPVLFVVLLQVMRPVLVQDVWPQHGRLAVSLLTHAGVLAFGLGMYLLVSRGYRLALRRNRELSAISDVLLAISRDDDRSATSARILAHTRHLLAAEEAGDGPVPPARGGRHRLLLSTVTGADAPLPRLWATRRGRAFEEADQRTIDTLAQLGRLAQDHARMAASQREAAVLTERVRIAREMHDSLAQVLSVTHMRLWALSSRPEVSAGTQHELRELAGICHEAHTDVRESIFGLRETARTDRSLLEGLDRCVEAFERQARIEARLVVEDGARLELPGTSRAHVLRLVQEALTNVRKHAGAETATVRVARDGDATVLTVEDDGCGFDPRATADAGRFGLHTMRERAEAAAGHLTVDSRPGRGTRIVVRLPAPRPTAAPMRTATRGPSPTPSLAQRAGEGLTA
ncbi:sensor histidine kinase [Piscicoccus intestinalis]|uniref:sensor histidine kinase n=1 Tax=Piscicoccus intestinalis TaxID=746033 RepID=UPI000838BBEB|nr:sensor histidine kinase [Piscicoccus intestinalis]